MTAPIPHAAAGGPPINHLGCPIHDSLLVMGGVCDKATNPILLGGWPTLSVTLAPQPWVPHPCRRILTTGWGPPTSAQAPGTHTTHNFGTILPIPRPSFIWSVGKSARDLRPRGRAAWVFTPRRTP
jgi:hypothetical protein